MVYLSKLINFPDEKNGSFDGVYFAVYSNNNSNFLGKKNL